MIVTSKNKKIKTLATVFSTFFLVVLIFVPPFKTAHK